MRLHREGTATILLATVFAIGMGAIAHYYIPSPFAAIFYAAGVFVWYIALQFFRIPKREKTIDLTKIVSPADGKVVVIEDTYEGEYLKKDCLLISVFMSPLNVHQNTYPVGGEVVYQKHHKGQFMAAWNPKASTLNERSTVVVKTKEGHEVLFRQVAGALARRICCYAKVGDEAKQSHEYGFIKFGSRVDLYLPKDTEVLVNIGDVVKNSQSVLAQLP